MNGIPTIYSLVFPPLFEYILWKKSVSITSLYYSPHSWTRKCKPVSDKIPQWFIRKSVWIIHRISGIVWHLKTQKKNNWNVRLRLLLASFPPIPTSTRLYKGNDQKSGRIQFKVYSNAEAVLKFIRRSPALLLWLSFTIVILRFSFGVESKSAARGTGDIFHFHATKCEAYRQTGAKRLKIHNIFHSIRTPEHPKCKKRDESMDWNTRCTPMLSTLTVPIRFNYVNIAEADN